MSYCEKHALNYQGKCVECLQEEVERLRELLNKVSKSCKDQLSIVESLRAQLAERDALLRDTKGCIERNDYPVFELLKRIDTALSASAEPGSVQKDS